ncbi:unnamed protein product [Gordionus sp. m RMFG-2023]
MENECPSGKYGTNCTADCHCNQNGSAENCSFFGYCHCLDGYWGDRCEKNCSSECRLRKCHQITGMCRCEDFKYGRNCDKNNTSCPDNMFCKENRNCVCKGWKYGSRCDQESTCNRNNTISPFSTGGCRCKLGYYGRNCEFECRTDCINSYWHNKCKGDGECWCLDGYYGLKCENKCNCASNEQCDEAGTCSPRLTRIA